MSSNSMDQEKQVFRKHMLAQSLNFLFLLPFILGFRPLILRFSAVDLLLYSLGSLVILLLIVISNRRPYVTLDQERLTLNLHYYQKPEIHLLERITLVEGLSSHSLKIHSRDYKPVRIHMNPRDMKNLLKLLNERNLKIL